MRARLLLLSWARCMRADVHAPAAGGGGEEEEDQANSRTTATCDQVQHTMAKPSHCPRHHLAAAAAPCNSAASFAI